jgi:dTDP-4-amino-4,6-dideoxygalactose transaminase
MEMIQYGKQVIEECDIEAVAEVMRENKYLTTGPRVAEFEQQMCEYIGCKHAIAMNSCTSALHACVRACGISGNDEVIVNTISFVASSNAVLYEGGIPVFCDIREDNMNLDVDKVESLINEKTKAIIFVDFAGQANDYHQLRAIAKKHNLYLIEDAAHSVGLQVNATVCPHQPMIGSYADLTALSFHPVKNMTTAEGGMVLTNDDRMAGICQRFRAHGIDNDYKNRHLHHYDMTELGYNYRITDLQCALGIAQLKRLDSWIQKRQEIASIYNKAFQKYQDLGLFYPLANHYGSAYHIYVIVLNLEKLKVDRDIIFSELRERGIGVNVHYKPIYLNTYYQKHPDIKSNMGLCPVAEKLYQRIITLPLHPSLTQMNIKKVIRVVKNVINENINMEQT